MKTVQTHKGNSQRKAASGSSHVPALQGVSDELSIEAGKAGIKLVYLVTGILVVGAIAYVVYGKITNRFQKKSENSTYPNANISMAVADSKAQAILQSIPMFGSPDLTVVSTQLAGLNYNGYIRLYNAFGKHTGELLGGELDLPGWLRQQFDDEDYELLGGYQNHLFF